VLFLFFTGNELLELPLYNQRDELLAQLANYVTHRPLTSQVLNNSNEPLQELLCHYAVEHYT